MFESDALLLFIFAGLVLNVTPGPDMLYVIARTLGQGRAAGLASAFGIGVGCFAHILAAVFGLTALLSAVPNAFDTVRLIGAAYLVWLGVKQLGLRRGRDATKPNAPQPASLGRIFRQGVITNVLNPKVALFFLAFLPQFVDLARGHAAMQFLTLGLLFDVNGMLVLTLVVFAASRLRGLFDGGKTQRTLERVMGAAFVGLGVKLAWK
jgi:threonine/homoserine/homoserine lactone efflux protein